MNLFVCGNGFDIAHKVKSEYFRFREWLIKEYSIDESTLGDRLFTGYSTNYKGYESYELRHLQNFLLN